MRNNRTRLNLAMFLITVLLIALIVSTEILGRMQVGTRGANLVVNPIQKFAYSANERIEKIIDFYYSFDKVRAENQKLKETLATYDDKIRRFDQVEKENVELKAMFEYKNRHSEYKYIGTNVINKNLNGISPSYTLDKGYDDGIRKGMAVITYEGLAGQITAVYPNYCILETISSENIKVSVTGTVTGTGGYVGILSGTDVLGKGNLAQVTQIALEASVKPGDDIITSGIGKFYPPDIYIGKIESISEDMSKLMKSATVIPAVKFTGGERFYIVLPKNMEDITY